MLVYRLKYSSTSDLASDEYTLAQSYSICYQNFAYYCKGKSARFSHSQFCLAIALPAYMYQIIDYDWSL
jgi:hypothetical protein